MQQLTPKELKDWIKQGKSFILIDVRELWEHENFNIGGQHIPLGELVAHKGLLDREKPVIIYCEKGIRSVIAIQRLEISGFQNLYNLQGGMAAWKKTLP